MNNLKKNIALITLGSALTFGGVSLAGDNLTMENADQSWRPIDSSTVFYFSRDNRDNLILVGFTSRDLEEVNKTKEDLYQEYLEKEELRNKEE